LENKDILKTALDRMDRAATSDRKNREHALNDMEFLAGKQWPESMIVARESEGKPVITINRMPQFLRQVTGDIRASNPSIDIIPGDDEANKEMAITIDGMVRQIEYENDASSVYEQAAESAAACGIGWIRARTEYLAGKFDQKIIIERIHNPFAVQFDPLSKDPTRKDSNYIFVTEELSKEDFKQSYPEATETSWDDQTVKGSDNWNNGDNIKVAEYYWKEPFTKTIYEFEDGTISDELPDGVKEVRKRQEKSHKIQWCKLTSHEVLEGPKEVPGNYIPVISVVGEEIQVGEEVVRSSVIRYAKDAQRMYNYWRSAQTELVGLQPKAPYKVTIKQIAGLEKHWENANTSNAAFLPYNPDPEAPPPQRETPPVASQGMSEAVALAADDMKATTGIYDSSLGSRSNEVSGIAIRQRQAEGDTSTSIYGDNLGKTIAHVGRIIVDWIPTIYDTNRVVRTLGKDLTAKTVELNGQVIENEEQKSFNPTGLGRFDIRISTGPSYSTQRQEASESMLSFMNAFPNTSQAVGDLVARNMDWPGADQFAERLKRMVPPEILGDDSNEELTPEQQQEKAQKLQQQQQEQQQQIELQKAMQAAELGKAEAESAEAEAEAQKAQLDVMEQQLKLSIQKGELQEVIQSAVGQQLNAFMQQQQQQLEEQQRFEAQQFEAQQFEDQQQIEQQQQENI
jgi:hypothetical protein